MKRLNLPKTLLWVLNIFLALFILFTLFRIVTFFAFRPVGISFADSFPSFFLGIQYDLRWISILILPIVLVSIYRPFSPFYSEKNRKIWTWYLAIVVFITIFFFIADLISFSYNRTRLDAGAMNFVEDPGISIYMIWQTYPIVWIIMGLVLAVFLFRWLLNKSHELVKTATDGKLLMHRKLPFILTTLLFAVLIYGNVGRSPLKWRDSFILRDSFKSYLALNPLQNFFSTMRLREPVYNEDKAREVFPVMAELLQLPETNEFNFKRTVQPRSGALESRPNIVLVVCESFSMYKSSMSGNPLNTTPYFDSLSKSGIFFERCFTPHFSTARGLFAILTGIPDVQLFKFSTRNPFAIDQYTIVNNFADYSKHYFLGGDPEFNNFKGLISNIEGLKIHNEANIPAPKINVWGISDKDLFLNANRTFAKEKKPFFAIIQTSDNHRPYTIPETDIDFIKKEIDKDTLIKYGFGSVEEYNTFRYADYCFRHFVESAKKEKYFHNTLFVFIGDHGVAGNATAMYPPAWTNQRLSDEHVPLLFYAPHLLSPEKHSEVVSQIDVLPTIAGLMQMPYTNTTMGRDLLDSKKKKDLAFITNTAGKIGIVSNEFYYVKSLEFSDEEMVPTTVQTTNYTTAQKDSIQKQLAQYANAYYQTAQYLLMNNKK